jgi:hypothetical protein
MKDPITRNEIEAALKGAMKYSHPKDDSEEARTIIETSALVMMKKIALAMSRPEDGNSPFDLARFWFAVGVFTSDARHGSEGGNLIFIPNL